MIEHSIPILAYVFISITSLVLTYVTLMDKTDTNSNVSATSMLPQISNPFAVPSVAPSALPVPVPVPVAVAEVVNPTQSTGGKSINKTKNKRIKHKNTKRNKKYNIIKN